MQIVNPLYVYNLRDNCVLFKVYKTKIKTYRDGFWWKDSEGKRSIRVNIDKTAQIVGYEKSKKKYRLKTTTKIGLLKILKQRIKKNYFVQKNFKKDRKNIISELISCHLKLQRF